MPYDDRLNGPDTDIPGTQADFSARALRHFVGLHGKSKIISSISEDAELVKKTINQWKFPAPIKRLIQSDAEIKSFINKNWDLVEGRSGKMLRFYRDSGFACEQSRFAYLFRSALDAKGKQQGALL